MTDTTAAAAAAMRAECAQPGNYQAANLWVTNALHVHLQRRGQNWEMELSDEVAIPTADAHAWAAAFGAPEGTAVLHAFGGRGVVAQWEDAAFDPAPAGSATYWGGAR